MQKAQNLLKYLLYLSIITLSLGQFASIGGGEGFKFYLFDFVVGLFAIYGIFYFTIVKKDFLIPKNSLLLIAFTLWLPITLVFRITTLDVSNLIIASFYLIRWVIYFISSLIIFNMIKFQAISKNKLFKLFFISALFMSIAGFVQLIILPDFTTLDPDLGWDPHKNRLASTFFDPNFTGGYLAIVLGLAIGNLFGVFPNIKSFNRIEFILFVLIPSVALFLTFSRSSWGMLAIFILVLGLLKKRVRWLLVVAGVLAFLTYFAVPRVQTRISGITDPADSAAFRLVSWGNTLEIAEDNLFLGTGFNTFRYFQKQYGFFNVGEIGGHSGSGSDSSMLLVLATTGIMGFVLFVGSYFYTSLKFLRKRKIVFLAIFAGLFLHSQFVNSLFYPQIMFLWLTISRL